MEPGGTPARGRAAIAIGAGVVLIALVVAVVALGGGDDDSERVAGPPPSECVQAWNSDPAATAYGRHNFNFHRYEGALVTYLTQTAEEVESAEDGLCAVVFPSQVLDTEPSAAGQVRRGGAWTPISSLEGIELTRVGELQVIAAGAPNAALEESGDLAEL